MADRRGSRFAFEVLFLVALTAAVTVAELRAVAIAGVLLLGWLLVAGIEWVAWRDAPHYSSGLPPRWYVPRTDLPPAQPLESVVSGYPEGRRDEAPTWIASAALREELLGEWPMTTYTETAPDADGEPLGSTGANEAADEAWTIVELPPSTADPLALEPVPDPAPAPAPFPAPDPDPTPLPDLDPAATATPQLAAELHRSAQALAQYSLDPLAEPARRRLGRRGTDAGPSLIVPARPEGDRALPRTAPEE